MVERASVPKTLGEIALRVDDLEGMARFYRQTLELEEIGDFDAAVFFKIAEGFGGHTQVLALFDRSVELSSAGTTLDHFALSIRREDFDAEVARLRGLGLEVETTEHPWVQWKSLYFRDPEGNLVELVCFDPEIPRGSA